LTSSPSRFMAVKISYISLGVRPLPPLLSMVLISESSSEVGYFMIAFGCGVYTIKSVFLAVRLYLLLLFFYSSLSNSSALLNPKPNMVCVFPVPV
jgi:uncharacterized membrane protein